MSYFFKQVIPVPLYRGKLIVMLTDEPKKVSELLPEYEDDEVYAHAIHTNWQGDDGFVIVLNHLHPRNNISAGCIAHEAYHTAAFIARCRGWDDVTTEPEPFAYLINWIVDEVYKFMDQEPIEKVINAPMTECKGNLLNQAIKHVETYRLKDNQLGLDDVEDVIEILTGKGVHLKRI